MLLGVTSRSIMAATMMIQEFCFQTFDAL